MLRCWVVSVGSQYRYVNVVDSRLGCQASSPDSGRHRSRLRDIYRSQYCG